MGFFTKETIVFGLKRPFSLFTFFLLLYFSSSFCLAQAPLGAHKLVGIRDGGFRQEGYWVWCGSVVQEHDSAYHLYASRWPRHLPFLKGYIFYSEVVHATARQPQGPYTFADVALPARGAQYWDGRMTHNPVVVKRGNEYLLFYIGSTYADSLPTAPDLEKLQNPYRTAAYRNIRIGMARSSSPAGPWVRADAPVLAPSPTHWDSLLVTNPAPLVDNSGQVWLVYRSRLPSRALRLGLARASHPDSAFRRVGSGPMLEADVEDPFLWQEKGGYHLVAKDMTGALTGERHAGAEFTSNDMVHWQPAKPFKAYSRSMHWDDGIETVQGSFERPFLLRRPGKPSYLFGATANGPGGFDQATASWLAALKVE